MYNHWSFGKSFLQNAKSYQTGRMGLAYELVINSNPCINYLMEENSVTTQALVIAHAAFGHNHFFKNNYMFKKWTSPEGIVDYLLFAKRFIAECEQKYGYDRVEGVLDACHSLQRNSVNKYKKPPKLNPKREAEKQKERSDYLRKHVNDLWRTVPTHESDKKVTKSFDPEENLLYFIEKNSPILESWEREICRIVRKVSQYFYPQSQTKVMNEGFASFTHYYIMTELHNRGQIDDGSYMEFLKLHTSVLFQPSFDKPYYNGFNPYCLGFDILTDVRRICEKPDAEDKEWFPDLADTDWRSAIRNIVEDYRDESAIRQFLGPKVMRKWGMFKLHTSEKDKEYNVAAIHNDKGFKAIRETLADQYEIGAMIPDIQVVEANLKTDRKLELVHYSYRGSKLREGDAKDVLTNMKKLWGYNVELKTIHNGKELGTYRS
jgi:spore cortex formation protein SpoVR/YcgB (stage V sporulation)